MNWDKIKSQLKETYKNEPQKAAIANIAVESAQAAMQQLAALGHRVELRLMEAVEHIEFPKMLYKLGADGKVQQLTVAGAIEQLKAEQDGWGENLDGQVQQPVEPVKPVDAK